MSPVRDADQPATSPVRFSWSVPSVHDGAACGAHGVAGTRGIVSCMDDHADFFPGCPVSRVRVLPPAGAAARGMAFAFGRSTTDLAPRGQRHRPVSPRRRRPGLGAAESVDVSHCAAVWRTGHHKRDRPVVVHPQRHGRRFAVSALCQLKHRLAAWPPRVHHYLRTAVRFKNTADNLVRRLCRICRPRLAMLEGHSSKENGNGPRRAPHN